jgi:hypothetical protein
LSSSGSYT